MWISYQLWQTSSISNDFLTLTFVKNVSATSISFGGLLKNTLDY